MNTPTARAAKGSEYMGDDRRELNFMLAKNATPSPAAEVCPECGHQKAKNAKRMLCNVPDCKCPCVFPPAPEQKPCPNCGSTSGTRDEPDGRTCRECHVAFVPAAPAPAGNLDVLREKFIRPDQEIEAMRVRPRHTTFPKADGYYWLQWPDYEDRPDPVTNKPHVEVCQYEQGVVLLIGTKENYRPTMKGREFKFYPIAEPETR